MGLRFASALTALASMSCATVPSVPARSGTTNSTRAVVERYWASAEAGNAEAASAVFADDAVYRDETFDFEVRGVPAIRKMLAGAFVMLRPVSRTILFAAYDRSTAAIEWEARGTHVTAVMGVPATNKPMTIRAVSLIEVRDGKIQAVTDYTDRAGLEAQLKP